jgi:hypothetical protein
MPPRHCNMGLLLAFISRWRKSALADLMAAAVTWRNRCGRHVEKRLQRIHPNRIYLTNDFNMQNKGRFQSVYGAQISRIIIIAIFLLFALNAPGFAATTTITVSDSMALRPVFLGYCAEWDSANYASTGLTASDFATITSRVSWMKLPVIRVMMQADYSSAELTQLYKILDYAKANNITVVLTEWGWGYGSSRYLSEDAYQAKVISYLGTFVNTKGYTNIKYLVLGNEPNYENYPNGFSEWKTVVDQMYARLAAAGLNNQIKILGPDTSNDLGWLNSAVSQAHDELGGYDVHGYLSDSTTGDIESYFTSGWAYPLANDPGISTKPLIIGEAGMQDGANHPYGNANINDYVYGLWMADYGVQAARSGSSAVCAWMLSDDSHDGFYWGMMDNRHNGQTLRPWFYTWSLLSRSVPKNSIIYKVTQPSGIRILASKAPTGEWTFVAVNRGSTSVNLRFVAPGASQVNFKQYVYSSSAQPVDSNGFPVPVSSFAATPSSGLNTTVPENSVVFLTQESGSSTDAAPPTTTITSPSSSATYSTTSSSVSLNGTASDNVGVTQVTWSNSAGGSGTATGTTSWTASAITLASGANQLTVTARDAAGNTGTDTITVTYTPSDTTPPVRSSGSPTSTLTAGTTSTTLSLTTSESATCRYSTNAGVAYSSMTGTFTTTGSTSHSRTLTGLSNGNSYTYNIRCQDSAGNQNTDDYAISFSIAQTQVVCGDTTCSATENCTTCPTDCGNCSVACLPAETEPCDGCISFAELSTYLARWKASSTDVTISQLIEAVKLWKEGCI